MNCAKGYSVLPNSYAVIGKETNGRVWKTVCLSFESTPGIGDVVIGLGTNKPGIYAAPGSTGAYAVIPPGEIPVSPIAESNPMLAVTFEADVPKGMRLVVRNRNTAVLNVVTFESESFLKVKEIK